MEEIDVAWLAGMVTEALKARGVDTTFEAERASIQRWLDKQIEEAILDIRGGQ